MGSAFFNLEDRPQNTGQALRAFPYHNLHLGTSLSPALGRGCGRTRTPLHYYIQNRGKMLPARRLLSREHQIDHDRGKPERCRFGGELVAHADGERMCERIIVQRIFQPLQRNTRRLLPGAENGEIPPGRAWMRCVPGKRAVTSLSVSASVAHTPFFAKNTSVCRLASVWSSRAPPKPPTITTSVAPSSSALRAA